ncbi:MAG TPA: TVP38/TMEM64 family protein [Syntrophorhabdales bacterium]|nr:TVP38/TMEM64 family protein [Syntrophorhabdales bacterium]
MRRKIVKSPYLSAVLRVLLGLLFLCLVVLVFYIYYTGGWRDTLLYYRYLLNPKRLKLFVASFGPYAAPVFVLLQCMQVVIAPIPGEVTGFVGGLLFGVWKGTLLSTIGLTIGALIAFSIGRLLGASFVHRIVKQEYIDRFDDFVRHRGLYIAWLLFILPGFPKDSLCYLLGLTRMRYIDLILLNVLGRLPGTLMLVLQGSAVQRGRYQEFSIYLVGSAVLVSALYLWRNQIIQFLSYLVHTLRKKRENKEPRPS